MLAIKIIPHSKDVGGVRVGEELEVCVVIGLAAGVVDAELCCELVEDVYDGDNGIWAQVEVWLGGCDGLGSGEEVWGDAEVALRGRAVSFWVRLW